MMRSTVPLFFLAGCGLFLDVGRLDEASDSGGDPGPADGGGIDAAPRPAEAGADAAQPSSDTGPPPAEGGPVDANRPSSCPGSYGVMDRVVLPNQGLDGLLDLASSDDTIGVLYRTRSDPGDEVLGVVAVDANTFLARGLIGAAGGEASASGLPRLVHREGRWFVASLAPDVLSRWSFQPGATRIPEYLNGVTAFALTDATAPDQDVLLVYVQAGVVTAAELAVDDGDPTSVSTWTNIGVSGGNVIGGIDLAWDTEAGAYALVLGEVFDPGQVSYQRVHADGSPDGTPVDLLSGEIGPRPVFANRLLHWGVRIGAAPGMTVVSYGVDPDGPVPGRSPVINVALVDSLSGMVIDRLFSPLNAAAQNLAVTALGQPDTFALVADVAAGGLAFQQRQLVDGDILENPVLEGGGWPAAVIKDPTGIGDYIVARKPLAGGAVTVLRMGCE